MTPSFSESHEPQPDRTVVYKTVQDQDLSLHLFLPGLPEPENDPVPVVVFFHGGGWSGGSPSQFYPQSHALREEGLLCISVEYRLTEQKGVTPLDCIRDAFDAMRYIKANAGKWGGDPQRIAAGGGSAGAHLAAATATLTAEDLAGLPEEAQRARPDLLLLFNPVYDNGPDGGYGTQRLLGRWVEASPAHNLHAAMPPTLVMVGDQDHLIPVETVQRVASSLEERGVSNRLVVYPGENHGFFNPGRGDGSSYAATLAETKRFLVEQGWLDADLP